MRKPSSKIKEDIARLQEQLKVAETREAERIGRLALKAGLGDIEIDLRTAKPCMAQCVPAADWIEALAANNDISQLTLGIPQVHRIPGGENRQIYPLIYHELESAIFDAVQNQEGAVVVGIVTLMVFFYIFFNLVVDVLYALLDPRIRYE